MLVSGESGRGRKQMEQRGKERDGARDASGGDQRWGWRGAHAVIEGGRAMLLERRG
jgi:hypothetical protein